MRGLVCADCGQSGSTLIHIATSDYISFNSSCAYHFPNATSSFYFLESPDSGRADGSLLACVGITGGIGSGPQFTRYGHHQLQSINGTSNSVTNHGAGICFEPATGNLTWFTFRNSTGYSLLFLGLDRTIWIQTSHGNVIDSKASHAFIYFAKCGAHTVTDVRVKNVEYNLALNYEQSSEMPLTGVLYDCWFDTDPSISAETCVGCHVGEIFDLNTIKNVKCSSFTLLFTRQKHGQHHFLEFALLLQ